MRQAVPLLRQSQGWLGSIRQIFGKAFPSGDICSSAGYSCRKASSLAFETSHVPVINTTAGVVHCTEALSSTDGPGLRYVVYLASQSRPSSQGGFCTTPTAVARDLHRYTPFLLPNGGGITCSGVDPLQQADFCASLFSHAHKLNVTTCLHTSPPDSPPASYQHVLENTDSLILQVNTLSASHATQLTPKFHPHSRSLANFTLQLHMMNIPYYVRYLLVPGITDQPSAIEDLLEFSKAQGSLLKGVQLMPYHQLGGEKWEALGLSRTLRGLKPFKVEEADRLINTFDRQGIQAALAS